MKIEKKIVKSLMLFAAKQDVRYYLKSLNVSVSGGVFRLIACDGSTLATYTTKCDLPDCNLMIPADIVDLVLKMKSDHIVFDLESRTLNGILFLPVEGTYPDCKRVWPSDCALTPPSKIYDPRLIAVLGKVMDTMLGKGKTDLQVWNSVKDESIVWQVGDLRGIVMSMSDTIRTGRMPSF